MNTVPDYVKIIRFDNEGFKCKPYSSDIHDYTFEFIDADVMDINQVHRKIEQTKVHRPKKNDPLWSGCFCFLEEYNDYWLSDSSILSIKSGHKMNVAFLHKNTDIWVRNMNHEEQRIYQYFTRYNETGYELYNSSYSDKFMWVRMSVYLALERNRLWKQSHAGILSEEIAEFYLLESQLSGLKYPPTQTKPSLINKFKRFFIKNN